MISARVIVVVAPIGFGKTRFARARCALDAGAFVDARDAASVFAAVTEAPHGGCIAVDDADALSSAAAAQLERRLAVRRDLTIVLTGRARPQLDPSVFAELAEIAVLGPADLAMSESEISRACDERAIARPAARAIARLSRGWPLAVLLLRTRAELGDLDAVLRDGAHHAYDELMHVIERDMLAHLDEREREALAALCAAPQLSEEAANELFKPHSAALNAYLVRSEQRVELHPLLRLLMRARRQIKRDAEAAAERLTATAPFDAALIYVHTGSLERADAVLASTATITTSNIRPQFDDALLAVPADELVRYPALWCDASRWRAFIQDDDLAVEETVLAARYAVERGTLASRFGTTLAAAGSLASRARFDEAERIAAAFPVSGDPIAEMLGAFIGDVIAAYREPGFDLERSRRHLAGMLANQTLRSAWCTTVAVPAYVSCGELVPLRDELRTAIELGIRNDVPSLAVLYSFFRAAFARLAADEGEWAEAVAYLRSQQHPAFARAIEAFMDAARGEVRPSTLPPNHEVMRCIVAALAATDDETRAKALSFARAAARKTAGPGFSILALLASAFSDASRRAEYLERANALASAAHATPWRNAIAACASGTPPPALRGLAALGTREKNERIELRLLDATVVCGERIVALSRVQHALLAALVGSTRGLTTDELVDRVYGTPEKGNALWVQLSKLRSRIGLPIVVRSGARYLLHPDVRLEHLDLRAALDAAPSLPLRPAEAARFTQAFERARATSAQLSGTDWTLPLDAFLHVLIRDIAVLLARDRAARGDRSGAFALVRGLLAEDVDDDVLAAEALGLADSAADRGWLAAIERQARDESRIMTPT